MTVKLVMLQRETDASVATGLEPSQLKKAATELEQLVNQHYEALRNPSLNSNHRPVNYRK